jgi:hypothetical protein
VLFDLLQKGFAVVETVGPRLPVPCLEVHGDKVTSIGEFIQIMEIVFDADEMALLGTIIAMWFGSRGNSKAGK